MSTSLIHLPSSGRPTVIQKGGWSVVVSIHDHSYQEEKRAWRRRLATDHPDLGGTQRRFIKTFGQYRGWLYRERKYYAGLGLLPPGWTSRDERQIAGLGMGGKTLHLALPAHPPSLSGKWSQKRKEQPS